jgi:hypothetical protein
MAIHPTDEFLVPYSEMYASVALLRLSLVTCRTALPTALSSQPNDVAVLVFCINFDLDLHLQTAI